MKSLFLLGMMGSGKSTLGKALAQFLDMPFIDMDRQIENRTDKSIVQIFREEGEAFFRQKESELLAELASDPMPKIVATGGGVVCLPQNRDCLRKMPCLFLDVPMDILAERLEKERNQRPLLQGEIAETLTRIYGQRKEWYEVFPSFRPKPELSAWQNLTFLLYALGQTEFSLRFDSLSIEDNIVLSPSHLFSHLGSQPLDSMILTSQSVYRFYQNFFPASLAIKILPDGESCKENEFLCETWQFLLQKQHSRSQKILALGGGSLTDIAGFAASTYKRGTHLELYPTTLLAQVDAAIGGKNAINIHGIKNAAGTFFMPSQVLVDPLVTLSSSIPFFQDGLVEGLKAAMLVHEDRDILRLQLQRCQNLIVKPSRKDLIEFVAQSIQDKMFFVRKDPQEKKERMLLNLGHTLGHVYETTFSLSHGKAVALGIYEVLKDNPDADIQATLNFFLQIVGKEHQEVLHQKWTHDMRQKLANDKKIRGNKLCLVSLEKPGKPVLQEKNIDSWMR